MCQPNEICAVENGVWFVKKYRKKLGGKCIIDWSEKYFSFLGRRMSDVRPKVRNGLPPKKKQISMDEAISKTSKWITLEITSNEINKH